jgi:hypothetical protein
MSDYHLALMGHVLVVVYLLGADLGRLYLARTGSRAEVAPEALRMAGRGVVWLGSATNLALILLLPAGVSLGAAMGAFEILNAGWLAGTWVVAAVWATVSLLADRLQSRSLRIADIVIRVLLAPGFIYDAAIVFTGTSQTVEAHWLALKIGLYGLLILLSIPLRWTSFALQTAMAANQMRQIQSASARLGLPILAGWIVILLAVWLGVAKPY